VIKKIVYEKRILINTAVAPELEIGVF